MTPSSHILSLTNRLKKLLAPISKKIEIAGSIRRREKNPRDIDFVIIPKNKEKIIEVLSKKGKVLEHGDKKARFKIEGVKVETYFTTSESWGATLLAYSSKVGSAIGLRIVARTKGFKLNQYGLFKKGKQVAGKTEKEIYNKLGRPYKKPEER